MDKLNNIVLLIQHYLADYILIILLLGGGVIFTIRLGFIQIRGFKAGWKRTFGGLFSKKGTAGKDGMSSFQALATAIAAQVGTGNIAGAATASWQEITIPVGIWVRRTAESVVLTH